MQNARTKWHGWQPTAQSSICPSCWIPHSFNSCSQLAALFSKAKTLQHHWKFHPPLLRHPPSPAPNHAAIPECVYIFPCLSKLLSEMCKTINKYRNLDDIQLDPTFLALFPSPHSTSCTYKCLCVCEQQMWRKKSQMVRKKCPGRETNLMPRQIASSRSVAYTL